EDLDQVALAAPEAKYLAAMRISAKSLLDLQRQTVHPAPHVRHATRDPDLHPGRKGDHRGSRTAISAARHEGDSAAGIVMRRPFVSVMSIRASSACRSGRSPSTTGSEHSISSGVKPTDEPVIPSVPLRYSRRQIESKD